ncbi:hypothetical protein N9L92_04080 [Saprospiraceae bacterium]|nr:hypothetical protein [Saprospiraceae bacterium]
MFKKITFILIIILAYSISVSAQEVAISDELSIRNYFSYELVGQVEDRILIYRDKGFVKEMDVYNEELEHTQFSEFIFEKKKSDVYTIIGQDTAFQMLYGFLKNDSLVIRMREYDKVVRLIDSTTLTKIHKKEIKRRFNYSWSEDKSKVLLTSISGDNLVRFIVYDCRLKAITWHQNILFDRMNYRDFQEFIITDHSNIILQIRNDGIENEKLSFIQFNPAINKQFEFVVGMDGRSYNDVYFTFDNKNQNVVVSGTYSEKRGKEVKGLFFYKRNVNDLLEFDSPKFLEFGATLGEEVLQGKKRNRKRVFDDLELQNVILRNDGGALVVCEITKDYSRRSPYNTSYTTRDARYSGYSRRGWVDYYNEDIVVLNINPEYKFDWTKVLYKKQFSQDDDAIFSSFYIMKTPSRLRFIYNDDIKKNSTVSEYLMDPTGRIARNSLLSTKYQDMKLRFGDAIQLSGNSILVPSEKSYDLNLVKITY